MTKTMPEEQSREKANWPEKFSRIGKTFSERAAEIDSSGRFVEKNFLELKAAKIFSAHVPAEFGGGGMSYRDLCDGVRILGQNCGSTSLVYSMHAHLLAALVWRWRNQKAPVEPLLRKIAAEELVLVSSGGSDWLNGSAEAVKVEGGFKVSGRKIFSSGSPMGDLLMTMGVLQDPENGPQVLHFPLSFKSSEIKILDTWDTLGMRGTGSHDLEINGAFVPDSAVGVRRAQGKWHPIMQVVALIAIPLIYSTYTGVAEAAREIALKSCAKKRNNNDVQIIVGEMENELMTAQLAWKAMVDLATSSAPGHPATNLMMSYRTLSAGASMRTVEKAMQAVGGASFYRTLGLERLFRDIQGARFHPLQEKPQQRFAGRFALGVSVDE